MGGLLFALVALLVLLYFIDGGGDGDGPRPGGVRFA